MLTYDFSFYAFIEVPTQKWAYLQIQRNPEHWSEDKKWTSSEWLNLWQLIKEMNEKNNLFKLQSSSSRSAFKLQ